MSDLAEYARKLHEKESTIYSRKFESVQYPSKSSKIDDVRAVICDIYGTIVNYWRPTFEKNETRTETIINSFKIVAERFGMISYLSNINPSEKPEKTLCDFYNGLIALNHEKSARKGIMFPEIKIEEIWGLIIMMLKRHGYKPAEFCNFPESEIPRYLAFTYNFHSLGRQLYPGVVNALEQLKKSNIVIGIVSNAQFYTPIDLTLFLREQSNQKIDDLSELFDPDLTFFSYEYGVAKPNQLLFRKLYDALYEYHILPAQTVFVGNDLSIDIQPAIEAGMKTAFFTGDKESTFLNSLDGQVTPDITFQEWDDLPAKISFFSERTEQ